MSGREAETDGVDPLDAAVGVVDRFVSAGGIVFRRDPDGTPFLEPTLELAMIDRVEDGAFDVTLLPISGKDSFAWQFVVRDKAANDLRLFRFPASDTGLFDLTGQTVCGTQGALFNSEIASRYLFELEIYNGTRDARRAMRDGRCIAVMAWYF